MVGEHPVTSAQSTGDNHRGRALAFVLRPALLVMCLSSCLLLFARQAVTLPDLEEAGYGDSYIYFDIRHFANTGKVYRDLSRPPFIAAQYSPLVYAMYSPFVSGVDSQNPFFGPRLLALSVVGLCIAAVASITALIVPVRFAWAWGVLMAGSIWAIRPWVLRLRGDFFGILCSLLTIRLLMHGTAPAVVLAGLLAGLALQFKITFVAALSGGAVWLAWQRRWLDAFLFVAAGLATSVGAYVWWAAREPRMMQQMFVLSHPIPEFRGLLLFIVRFCAEPVVWLALVGLLLGFRQARARSSLLVVVGVISFLVALATGVQAGGNINYFFETLFTIVPLAALGATQLIPSRATAGILGIVFAVILTTTFVVPNLYDSRVVLDSAAIRGYLGRSNAALTALDRALQGVRTLSTAPRIAIMSPDPVITEPFLVTYLNRVGKYDLTPLAKSIRERRFDVVVTNEQASMFRGIPYIAPDLRAAIHSSYEPYCQFLGRLFHLRKRPGRLSAVARRLDELGCKPVDCNASEVCRDW